MNTKILYRYLLWLGFALLCATTPAGAQTPLKPVTLQLKWLHQFQFAGYYAAIEQGYYREAGLDVRLREAAVGMDLAQEVVTGRAEFGVGTSEVLIDYAQGQPVVMLAPIFQHSPLMLLVRADSGIDSVHDLPGRRLMVEAQSAQLWAYLLSEGLSLESLQTELHNFGIDDLLNNRIDGISAYSTDETFLLQQANIPYRIFTPRTNGMDFYGDLLFTSAAFASAEPETVKAFTEASLQGWEYALAHPDEITRLIYQRYSQRHSLEHLRYEAERTYQMIRPDLIEVGYSNPGRWRHIIETYQRYGLMPADADLSRFFYQRSPAEVPIWLWSLLAVLGGVALLLALILWPLSRLNRRLSLEIQERRKAEALLLAAQAEAEQANLAKRQFLAHMSHEIRTPLNGILGMLDLLARSVPADSGGQQGRYLEMARSSAQTLLELVGNILDFSRIEAGKLGLDPAPFDLLAWVEESLLQVALRAHQKQLKLTASLPPDLPLQVIGDAPRLRQVLLNLLGNAIKFTDHGRVQLLLAAEALPEGRWRLRFQVEDTGIGLSSPKTDQLFLPFEQQDASITRRYGGSGLGLAISRELMALMQGELGAYARPEGGACFWFELTLATPAAVPARDLPVLSTCRVAICSPDTVTRAYLEHLLSAWQVQRSGVYTDWQQMASALRDAPGWSHLLLDAEALPPADFVWPPGLQQVVLAPLGIEAERLRAAGHQVLCLPLLQADLLQALQLKSAPLPVAAEAPLADSAATGPGSDRPLRILLAEDNPINQLVAEAALKSIVNCELQIVHNGQEALDYLNGQTVDLVLMDLQMPVMDGLAALQVIRSRPALANVPVIAATAHAFNEDRQACLAAGFSDYIAKPFLPETLAELVQRWRPPVSESR